MTEPRWITKARSLIGVKEVPGPKHSAEVLQMWRDIKRGGIKDDETPWCAAFVGAVLERCGITSSRFESAKSYETWGRALEQPAVGAIAVFSRTGGGHVGFVVGRGAADTILVLGGNQGNEVNVRVFPLERVTALRWPAGEPLPVAAELVRGKAPATTGEA